MCKTVNQQMKQNDREFVAMSEMSLMKKELQKAAFPGMTNRMRDSEQ